MSSSDDIRVVVGVDFGTTYSGFAYAHKSNPNDVQVYDFWKGLHGGWFKTPTVINYDDSCANVMSWGLSALATKPRGRSLRPSSKPIELFKLHLLKRGTTSLPDALNYKDVIKDYLKELGNYIRRRVKSHWHSLDFDSQVIIVITVPAEFDDNAIETMSECAIGANLVKEENIERNLKFTTEPEAAAINSISSLRNEYLLKSGDLFMVVDCGGGTVDLTTRELLDEDKLSEITNPVTSVMKGAVKFGLSEEVVESRVLNWTYGTCVVRKWLPTDPLSYKLPNGYVKVFEKFGEEGYGAPIKLNSKVIKDFKSFSLTQRKINIDMYVTKSLDAKYIGDPEIKLLRKFQLELPELDSYEDIEDITISFILKFGRVGMSAIAENKNTGHECKVTFKYDFDLV
ncbi:unnamed protein product [Rhizophagus irregularis]|uniref:Actin-like ATPase domain-containing protein n=1 Tax=Rhizophagus irregularis TaxID=588596 RepID=A0A915YRA4_9GLOM|nr:unnamed protein product [Rhizophagus irregularis]CAB5316561.1 unnamed protein product [Rhizophagus irregularis]